MLIKLGELNLNLDPLMVQSIRLQQTTTLEQILASLCVKILKNLALSAGLMLEHCAKLTTILESMKRDQMF